MALKLRASLRATRALPCVSGILSAARAHQAPPTSLLVVMALAWYFEGESRKTPESSDARPSLPSDSDYANDMSRIFISLNNTGGEDQPDGTRAGAGARGGRSRRRETDEDRESTQSSGTLAEYFSSLFDESFCSHSFKLVG